MTDNDLLEILITHLEARLAVWPFTAGYGPVEVQAKQQPTKQGVPTAPTVFIEKLFDHRYGWTQIQWDTSPLPDMLEETETQMYATTFQVSAMALQDVHNTYLPTASDLASIACDILQSRHTTFAFAQKGVGLLRATEVRNTYSPDDQDRQEASPSFDLVLTYPRSMPAVTLDKIARVEPNIVQVP